MALRLWTLPTLGLLVLLVASATQATEPSAKIDPQLIGPWHTVSIDGDALFLILDGIELDLAENGTFDAHVRFTDGQSETKRGHFTQRGDRLDFAIPGIRGKESVTYKVEDDGLLVHDASFGVTIRVVRGKAKDASGLDLF